MLPSQNSTVSRCLICSRALQFVRPQSKSRQELEPDTQPKLSVHRCKGAAHKSPAERAFPSAGWWFCPARGSAQPLAWHAGGPGWTAFQETEPKIPSPILQEYQCFFWVLGLPTLKTELATLCRKTFPIPCSKGRKLKHVWLRYPKQGQGFYSALPTFFRHFTLDYLWKGWNKFI